MRTITREALDTRITALVSAYRYGTSSEQGEAELALKATLDAYLEDATALRGIGTRALAKNHADAPDTLHSHQSDV